MGNSYPEITGVKNGDYFQVYLQLESLLENVVIVIQAHIDNKYFKYVYILLACKAKTTYT